MAKLVSLNDRDGDIIYPKSLTDAIYTNSGTTVTEVLTNAVYMSDKEVVYDPDIVINANTLNGKPASYYASASDVTTTYNEIINLKIKDESLTQLTTELVNDVDDLDEALNSLTSEFTSYKASLSNVNNTSDLNKPISTATQTALNTKANSSDLTTHTSNKTNPHGVTKTQVGLGNVDNTSDLNKPVSTATQTAINTSYTNANKYTDEKIASLINGAPTTLDTLKEIADAMAENEEVVDILEASIGSKASQTSLDTHTNNSTIHVTTAERTNWNSAKTHADSAHAPSNAQANQNAFSNITVGTTTVAADTPTDTLTLVAGSNVTITPDATNDKITITAKDTVYTHPSYTAQANGLYKVTVDATGHVSQATIVTKGDITALGIPAQDTTYTLNSFGITATAAELNALDGITATVSELNYCDGVTSNIQTQLNGKAASSHGTHVTYGTSSAALGTSSAGTAATVSRSDHVHALPALTSCTGTLTVAKGGTGATTAEGALTNLGLTATATELNYCDGVTSNIQTQLDGKQTTINGAASTITSTNLTASRAIISNSSGKVAVSDITSTELGYLDGVTSNIQTQLNSKASSGHNHSGLSYGGMELEFDSTGIQLSKTVQNSDGSQSTSIIWDSSTKPHALYDKSGAGYIAEMQSDGNFVVTKSGKAVWSSTNVLAFIGVTTPVSELNYCQGLTSNAQTQLNNKAPSNHTHGAIIDPNGSGYRVDIQSDGNLVVKDKNDNAIWNSKASSTTKGYLDTLATFSGTTETVVNTGVVINQKYTMLIAELFNSTGDVVGSISIPAGMLDGKKRYLYGPTSDIWGYIIIGEETLTLNRASSTTSSINVYGVLR